MLLGAPGDPAVVEASRPGRPADPACAGPSAGDIEAAAAEAASRGLAVVGTWHAHPDSPAEPSAADVAAARPGFPLLIVTVRGGQAAEWACWIAGGKPGLEPVIVRLTAP